jgi:hypothetical protein
MHGTVIWDSLTLRHLLCFLPGIKYPSYLSLKVGNLSIIKAALLLEKFKDIESDTNGVDNFLLAHNLCTFIDTRPNTIVLYIYYT